MAISTLEILRQIKNMEKGNSTGLVSPHLLSKTPIMWNFTTGRGGVVFPTGLAPIKNIQAIFIKDNLKMDSNMERDKNISSMPMCTEESTLMDSHKALGITFGLMGASTREILSKDSEMDTESGYQAMGSNNTRDSISWTRKTDMGNILGGTVTISIKVILKMISAMG